MDEYQIYINIAIIKNKGKSMELLKNMLGDILVENTQDNLLNKMRDAKAIITKYTSAQSPYDDFIMRLAGFSNGMTKPNPDKPGEINVIPVLDELAAKGYVKKLSDGVYKRTDVLSRLISQATTSAKDRALGGDPSKEGRLGYTRTNQMSHFGGDGALGDKLKNAPRNYKAGGKYSADTKEAVLNAVKGNDPAWDALPDTTKEMTSKLNDLENPLYSFTVLRALLKMQGRKKGYVDFVKFVQDNFKDSAYVDALYGLADIGAVDLKNGTVNNSTVRDIRNVLDFMEEETVEGIEPIDKIGAFLPKFIGTATSTSGTQHRELNNIVLAMHPNSKNKRNEFVGTYNIIQNRLTDDKLQDILSKSREEIKGSGINVRAIYALAKGFNVDTVDELKQEIETKFSNRTNYGSEENKAAKNIGRVEEFKKIFDL